MFHILINEDGNSDLKGRKFPIPKGVMRHLRTTLENYTGDRTIDGYKRLNNLLQMDGIAYDEMKRLKNYFDHYDGPNDTPEYILNGGDAMKTWVNNTLGTATKAVHDFKQTMKDAGLPNMFIKSHEKNRQTKPNKPTTSKVQTKNVGNAIQNNSAIRYETIGRKEVIITESQARVLYKELTGAN